MALTERARELLRLVIAQYVSSGRPVGSQSIVENNGIALSPSTVRSVLSDLEEQGYLVSPHHSAGRVPTAMGYRFFVNTLLKVRDAEGNEREYEHFFDVRDRLETSNSPHLIEATSSLLSQLTNFVGLVTFPKRNNVLLKHVEFLHLSTNRVLSVLVLSTGEVENRVFNTQRSYSKHELEYSSNYINSNYAGKTLADVRANLLKEVKEDKKRLDETLREVLIGFSKATERQPESIPCSINGQDNLLTETNNVNHLRAVQVLLASFTQKSELLDLLDNCMCSSRLQIFIGGESEHKLLEYHSLILSPYYAGEHVVGVLGVIGPTRMHYDRVISVVDVTSKVLSELLEGY